MSQEKFKKFLSKLEYEEGKIFYGNARMWFASTDWVADLQKRTEETLGPSGAFAIFADATRKATKRLGKKLAKQFKDLSIEELIKRYCGLVSVRGHGNFQLVDFSLDPFHAKIRYEDSYIEGMYENADEGKCYIMYPGIGSIIETFLQERGYDKEITASEPKCVAKGDEYCIHEFKEK